MAKHGKRRKFRRYIPGNVDEDLDLGTLASRTLVSTPFDDVVNERTLISSLEATYSLSNETGAEDDGPIMVGVAHSDYTAAEVEEFIESTTSWNEGDLIGQEVGRRKIKIVGIFQRSADPADTIVLNNGRPIKTKLKWVLLQGQTLDLWAYNLGTSAVAATVPTINCQGKANLWPL